MPTFSFLVISLYVCSSLVLSLAKILLTLLGMLLQHIVELTNYSRYGLWWIALGVASSIGLGEHLKLLDIQVLFSLEGYSQNLYFSVSKSKWKLWFHVIAQSYYD